ncbi:MAG: DsrE family protein [Thioalkalispiraceae bacterium]|jgi:intracellular sulfur oxidation DsrE/DsrF family protein
MKKTRFIARILPVITGLLLLPVSAYAQTGQQRVEEIIKLKEEPAGVVIEIVTGNKHGLEWALPMAKKYINTLQQRFPDLDIAIVTHGREQFALQKDSNNKKVHSLTQQLGSEGIPVHICETHAGWRGVTAEDFPEYVNVAAAGPAQINDYIAVGYLLVKIKNPE